MCVIRYHYRVPVFTVIYIVMLVLYIFHFQFLNAASKEVSVIDPFGSNEEEQSKTAGKRFRYF